MPKFIYLILVASIFSLFGCKNNKIKNEIAFRNSKFREYAESYKNTFLNKNLGIYLQGKSNKQVATRDFYISEKKRLSDEIRPLIESIIRRMQLWTNKIEHTNPGYAKQKSSAKLYAENIFIAGKALLTHLGINLEIENRIVQYCYLLDVIDIEWKMNAPFFINSGFEIQYQLKYFYLIESNTGQSSVSFPMNVTVFCDYGIDEGNNYFLNFNLQITYTHSTYPFSEIIVPETIGIKVQHIVCEYFTNWHRKHQVQYAELPSLFSCNTDNKNSKSSPLLFYVDPAQIKNIKFQKIELLNYSYQSRNTVHEKEFY